MKWLSRRAFRLWRNVGLGGMLPSGLEDEGWRGRCAGRDTAFADLLYSSGLRRREGGTLLTFELPALGQRNYYAGKVGQAVAKRAGYTFYVGHPALQRVEGYRMSTRALAVARARAGGVYERLPDLRVVREVNRAGRVRWTGRDGRAGENALGRLTASERMRLFVDGEDGLEPAMLWLSETGLPLEYTSWTKVFERASNRCAALGLEVFATPKMLRHSMALRMLISLHNALDRRLRLTPAQRLHYEEVYGQVWLMVKDMLGHRSEQVTRDVYLEPVRGLQPESYAGRSKADMLDVLDQEKGLALAETLTEAGERIAAGEKITGPAADRYRAAAAEFSNRYAGTYLGKRELRALVANPASRSTKTRKPS
ncbi:hypothetical protein [Streptosporangium sandarakinum]|uniref:hypothetical protein n=1 Tax=Streptosporangium sandarakinum TaxID=1260955 RepID=UPI003449A86A